MYGHYAATRRHFTVQCKDCGGSGIEFVNGGNGNVLEEKCSTCDGSGQVLLKAHQDPAQLIALAIMICICLVAGVLYYAFKGA